LMCIWMEISDEEVRRRAGKCLRVGAPGLREKMLSANDNRGGDAPSTNKVSPLSLAAASLEMIQQPQIADCGPGDCITQQILAVPL
jgi:hypothetical protein